MPRISAFYGIVIWMYHDEGPHPGRTHFHAEYGDDEASFDIETLDLIVGRLPGRASKLVLEWAELHRGELRSASPDAEVPSRDLRSYRARRHESRGDAVFSLESRPQTSAATED